MRKINKQMSKINSDNNTQKLKGRTAQLLRETEGMEH
jgi:hypothetical protein